jgi:hypothetical protein
MSSKDSKLDSLESDTKKPADKKPVAKKPADKKTVAKKPAAKTLTFQGREVQIIKETKSRKGQDRDLLDLKFLDEDRVFRIKRRALDK